MLSEELQRQLTVKQPNNNKNIGRLVGRLYKYIQKWHEEKNPKPDQFHITPSLSALLSNINLEGSNNKDLAKCSFITKQAMSKLLNETSKSGLIEVEKNKDDSRSNDINLTENGAELLMSIWENNELLIANFEEHIGHEKTQLLLEILYELSESLTLKFNK